MDGVRRELFLSFSPLFEEMKKQIILIPKKKEGKKRILQRITNFFSILLGGRCEDSLIFSVTSG